MAYRLSSRTRTWLQDNWTTFAILMGVFALALFLRTYFSFDLATSNGFVLSGGSDSYYHKRIIDAVVQTGRHVFEEPLLNYPAGIQASGRPPLYDWSVAVSGIVLAPFFASVDVAVWYSFLFSTAFWGALTIFPLYFLTKEAFGRRAGLIGAFFLAVMPAHIQRSPFTNGDHDAYLLFFVVATFFFFLKALRSLEETRWVKDWRKPKEVVEGLKKFYAGNQTALLYALMSAMSITAIALAWKGFAYVIVILLLYLLLQFLINRFRNVDSMGVLAVFAVTVGVSLLLSFPWYASYGFVQTWFDVPAYLYLIALVLGGIFVVTRDYPWTLVLPGVFILVGGGFLVASAFVPGLADAFVSGAGYFVRTKAYETIAEAQAPNFSQVALSLGAVTYYLSLAGLLWAAVQIPKRPHADYLFVVVWSGAAIFMALGAARFLFNGAPAFAATSAWVVTIILDRLDFTGVRRTFKGLRGNKLTALRKSVKVRHVVGALFIAFLVVMPNVWYGVDASIPIQSKKAYDEQVYNALPEFVRPAGYTPDSNYFLGAFGYSLPLKRQYFPSAWTWLREQDSGTYPLENRPAFLSWWDYGFEAVNEGQHPTVADNFLDGYQLAGNFIMAQGESEAIAYLSARLLEGDMAASGGARELSPGVAAALEDHGVDVNLVVDTLRFPALFKDDIIQNPSRYGPRDARMDNLNAMFIALKTELVEALPSSDQQADLYRDIRAATGNSIRYFAVDTRLFPFDGVNTGIFYAPAKLSDHRIHTTPTGGSIPCDFYDITIITDQGNFPTCTRDLPPGARATDNPRLDYHSMFFNTMLYRAFVGYGPEDLEKPISDGVPGLSGNLKSEEPLLGWNLSHFRVAYRTAYYNPYPAEDVANHTDAWRAMNLLDVQEMQRKIQRGEAAGVMDPSFNSFSRSGIVLLKYYDGAIVEGTVTVEGGTPFPGARVTVSDELGVPHDSTVTDEDGRYRVYAPFGEVTVAVTLGQQDLKTKRGDTLLDTATLTITDEQAMRAPFDRDGDGTLDYLIRQDFAVKGGSISGTLFLDADGNEQKDAGEGGLEATLTFTHGEIGTAVDVVTASNGSYRADGLYPGTYDVTAFGREREQGPFEATVTAGEESQADFAVSTGTLQVNVTDPDGLRLQGVQVVLEDLTDGTTYTAVTNEDGQATFSALLGGPHMLAADLPAMTARLGLTIFPKGSNTATMGMEPAGTVTGTTRIDGGAAGFITLEALRDSSSPHRLVVTSDETGAFSFVAPEGTYDLYAYHQLDETTYADLRTVTVSGGETVSADLDLERAAWVHGRTLIEGDIERSATVTFTAAPAFVRTVSSGIAEYRVYLPPGEYAVSATGRDVAFHGTASVQGDTELDLLLTPATSASGAVYRDLDGDGQFVAGEEVVDAMVVFTDGNGGRVSARSGSAGEFTVLLQSGVSYALSVGADGYGAFAGETRAAEEWASVGNISLDAGDVSVSGTLTFTDEPATVVVTFMAQGAGAKDSSVIATGGVYSASLAPGPYAVSVVHNLTESGDTRYENEGGESINIDVGDGARTLDIRIVKRHMVNGSVTIAGTPQDALVRFNGPEDAEVTSAGGSFAVYLAPGEYSVTSEDTINEDVFAYLDFIAVSAPVAQMDVDLRQATTIVGTLNTPSGVLQEPAVIRIMRDVGGSIDVTADKAGSYEVALLAGDYTLTVDHATTKELEKGVRYVRYVAAQNLTVPEATPFLTYPIDLAEVLDTVNVTGRVTVQGVGVADTQLVFTATSPSAVDLTAASGGDGRLQIAIAPGDYDLYAHRAAGHSVLLRNVSFEPHVDRVLDLELVDGLRVSGTMVYDGGLPTSGNVSFAANATVVVTAGDDGRFEAYLPRADYQLDAEAVVPAAGREDTYSASETLNLTEDTVLNVRLEKRVHYGVDLVWVEGQAFETPGGQSVVYHVAVTNDGNVADTYQLTGIPPKEGWEIAFSKDTVTLAESSPSDVVEVTVTPPVDALKDHGPLNVRATSTNDTSVSAIEGLAVDITEVNGVDLALSGEAPRYDGEFIHQKVKVMNTGNVEATFSVTILNGQVMAAEDWEASLVAGNGTVFGTTATGIVVGANSSTEIVVRFRNSGGAGSTEALLLGHLAEDRGIDRVFAVTATSPSIALSEANVNIQGSGITLALEEDLTTLAALPVAIAVIALMSLVYVWRKRRRRGR